MGMQLTLTNIFQFISGISPLLLGFFLVMMSIFNQNLKGLIYLSGVLIASVLNLLVMGEISYSSFRSNRSTKKLTYDPYAQDYKCGYFDYGYEDKQPK